MQTPVAAQIVDLRVSLDPAGSAVVRELIAAAAALDLRSDTTPYFPETFLTRW